MKYDVDFFKDYLKNTLSKDRYEHSLAVADLARELAIAHNYDSDKAYFAGLVHDIAKEMSEEEHDELLRKHNDLDGIEYSFKVKHSFCGKYVLMDDFNIDDEEILDAVYYHTVPKSNKILSKIVYISDKRDSTRNINDEVVDVAKKDLDKAVSLLLEKFNKRKEYKVYDAMKEIIDKKFGENLTILDFRNKTPFMDYAFVCSARNSRVAASIVDEINKWCKVNRITIYGQDFKSDSWQYIDIGDIVVHIFIGEARELYDLDGLWKDLIIK